MKQPFTYPGGKQRMAHNIIPHIPRHTVYVEPFCGGATILFTKKTPIPTDTHHYREFINDTSQLVVNFFKVLQRPEKAEKLIKKLKLTPYSQDIYNESKSKVHENKFIDDVDKAYSFFALLHASFGSSPGKGFAYSIKGANHSEKFINKVENLEPIIGRLKKLYIFNEDALKVIDRFDAPQTFFYVDPPYINTWCSSYDRYTEEDYKSLIEKLKVLKGSFILSCYATGYEPESWKRVDFKARCSLINGKARKDNDSGRVETIFIKDNGGGMDQSYFKKVYDRPEFQAIWPSNQVQMGVEL